MLIGRTSESRKLLGWAATGAGPITVWGPSGIGKSKLVHDVLPGWRHVDARGLQELPDDADVVWDGVDPEVARRALRLRPRRVVITTLVRLGVDDERALGLGPLAVADAQTLLQHTFDKMGQRVSPNDVRAIAAPLDGLPGALVEAARWLDLVGLEGLTAWAPRGWQAPSETPPHLQAVFESLDRAWRALGHLDRVALSALAMVEGSIQLEVAGVLVEGDPFERLRTLREQGWLVLVRPGVLRMLKPMRAYVLRAEAPPSETIERFVDWLLDRADADWAAFDQRGAGSSGAYLDDLDVVTQHRSTDPRVTGALCVLTQARPTVLLEMRVEQALSWSPRSVELLRSRCRLHLAAGELDAATEVIATLLAIGDARVQGACHCVLGAIAHQTHQFDLARVRYRQAIETSEAAGDTRGVAFAQGNLASLAHDSGDFDEAFERYGVALNAWRQVGDEEQLTIIRSNLALTKAAQGNLSEALEDLADIVGPSDRPGVERREAAVRGSLGWLCFLADRPKEAEQHLAQALAVLGEHRDVRVEATLLAQRAAVLCSLGKAPEAIGMFDKAERLLGDGGEFRTRRLVSLLRGFRDVAMDRRDDALARLAAARRGSSELPPLVEVSEDARSAAMALEAHLMSSQDSALFVARDGAAFCMPQCEPVSLQRFATACRLLAALASARIDRPGQGLGIPELFAAGWPNDQIMERSMRNRVHVVLNKLRAMGLRQVILRGDVGYLIDPQVQVLLVGSLPAVGRAQRSGAE